MSIFLSYRREDSAGYAGRLFEHLSGVFGPERVFMDVQDIAPGQDFAETIETTISACQAVIVIIGLRWATDFKQRSNGEDFVRHEVAAALRRSVTVIPVLVGGATMPAAADLPDSLAELSRRQALEIRDARFDDDVKLLLSALQKVPGISASPPRPSGKRWGWILAAAVLLLAVVSLFLWNRRPSFNIDGLWIAEMNKANQRPYRVRVDLAGGPQNFTGSVRYPTGDGAIQGGRVDGNRLTFYTVHVPQFASEPAIIRWAGIIDGNVIRFTAADDNGVASGIAHRSQ